MRVADLFEGHATAELAAIKEGGEPLRPPSERHALRVLAAVVEQVEGSEAEVIDRRLSAPAHRRRKVVDAWSAA
ncbi:MAG: hypothetical protein NTU94_05050 [Planctomycetota bacterium]|nr:hypothetical protein [Planctomycetota bacterium]